MNPALCSWWVENGCCLHLLLAAQDRREAWQGPAIFPVSFLEKKDLLVVTKALARDLQHRQWVSDGGSLSSCAVTPKVGNIYVTWSGLFRSMLPAPADVALQCAWEALFRQDSSFRELYF